MERDVVRFTHLRHNAAIRERRLRSMTAAHDAAQPACEVAFGQSPRGKTDRSHSENSNSNPVSRRRNEPARGWPRCRRTFRFARLPWSRLGRCGSRRSWRSSRARVGSPVDEQDPVGIASRRCLPSAERPGHGDRKKLASSRSADRRGHLESVADGRVGAEEFYAR